MSYAKVLAVGLVGLVGHVVEVEADLASGLPGMTLTGLPDAALSEARDRVRAALVNSGETWPNRRITVNLLPAATPKHGSAFDLAVAVTVLAGAGALPLAPLQGVVLLGELGLDGTVRPVRGVLPGVLAAVRAGIRRVVVPAGNAREAALVPGINVRATDTLRRLLDFVRGSGPLLDPPATRTAEPAGGPDLAEVVGQELGRRGLELAAAGGHHLSMIGPPGAGRTSSTVAGMSNPGKLSGYVRLSREAGDSNTSLAGMVRDVVALAERHGYGLADHPRPDCPASCEGQPVHVDDGISGAVRSRPAFQAWLADGREDCTALAAWRLDRISREGVAGLALLMDVLEGKDSSTGRVIRPTVRYLDCSGLDSTNVDAFQMQAAIYAVGARMERSAISARNVAKARRLLLAGRWPGGPAPYGFEVVAGKVGKVLAVEPAEAAAVQTAASMVLAGDTLGEVTRWLTAHAPARRAAGWTRSTVKALLTSYGLTGAAMARPRNDDGTRRLDTRATEPILTDDGAVFRPWPEVLTPATVDALRHALSGKPGGPRKPAGGRVPSWLLTGLLTCSGCGGPMVIHHARGTSYFCQSWQKTRDCPQRVSISADRADRYVTGLYLDQFGAAPMMAPVVTVTGGGDAERIQSEISDVMRAMAREATPERFQRLQALQADLAAAGAAPVERRTEWRPTGRTFAEEWAARDDVIWRRSVLAEAFQELRVLPGRRPVGERIEVTWSRRRPAYEALADIAEQERWQ